ncbi:acetylserotonin O-methyltransferase 2 [Antennarius striatus]|uniref:acetylserotonin O-methyltransferase 2 n=1 Tax=Antennarius striatus TaxID=241820 RepID=UPI0035AE5C02
MAKQLSQREMDYPDKLLEYLNGFRFSKVIFSACELGVFDLLLTSQEPLSAQQVAQELSASADGMERLMDTLVGLQILDVETTNATALYSNTDLASRYLAKGSPRSLWNMIIYFSQSLYPLWSGLGDTVRAGKNQNEKNFGIPTEDVFHAIFRTEEEMVKFLGLMDSTWAMDGLHIVRAFDLSCFQKVVDVGGCTGALAREVAKAYPSSSVTVFDLPQTVEMVQKHFARDDTVMFQPGDFFTDDIPPADLYILARIIHDWPEEKGLKLLKKIYDTCKTGGGVLLVEALLLENRRGPVLAQVFSLNMMIQTEGRERHPSDYIQMLNKVGFLNVQVSRTEKTYDAILALK